ncbi:SUKH-4 family immunity protein [Streptomyces sp. NPDC006923]|uniref:SUKH-4 family immunity protein n=1 Tax=Streptomyces sp. NPDC006923 TaxID=3155355 RepID=UPI003405CFB0
MVTFAQAQERADDWVNGDVPGYQHREVRVREFELGFVVWAEDREDGPTSDGGRQRLVIARDSGEATLWPGLPVGEVIRRYEEEYGAPVEAPSAAEPPQRIDLNQTSFLLTPPEWLQEAADRLGISDRRPATAPGSAGSSGAAAASGPSSGPTSGAGTAANAPGGGSPWAAPGAPGGRGGAYVPTANDGVPAGATPWAGTDTNASPGSAEDGSVPLPATVFAAPLPAADEVRAASPVAPGDAPTTLLPGGGELPPTTVNPVLGGGAAGPGAPLPAGPGAADIADAATSKAQAPRRGPGGGGATPPPPPGAPGVPGARPSVPPPLSGPGAPGAPAGGYLPTQLVPQAGPGGPRPSGPPAAPPPGAPGPSGVPGGEPHHAPTMFAGPARGGQVPPPAPPQVPGPPGPPGVPGGAQHAETMLAGPGRAGPPPAPPGPPGVPPAGPGPVPPPVPAGYGYPQQPPALPTVGPGYQAVLRYRAPDGSEARLIRRSAPGTPHPEWQLLHELRALNVPPQQVLELHTELESCELPGGYCARMIRETWPQVRITSVAPYGQDHAGRQQGMRHLLTHQGELHQVADGPARPAPVRAPLPPLPPAPPVPPEGVAQELMGAFGPAGICRFDQRAVSRQGVPEIVARTLVWAGLPADFGPFFWAQPPQPVVPTLAELAAQRQVPAAPDANSYLVMGSDFGRAICVQYGTAHIMAVPVEAGPGGQSLPAQFVNTGLPEFARSLALLGRMWRLRFGLNPEQAGRWTVDFQAQLSVLDPAALSSPESWWSVLLEQMWDGLL